MSHHHWHGGRAGRKESGTVPRQQPLKSADGQAALHRLAASSDVLLHSIRSTAASRIGLAPETLAALNPRLIACHVKGFRDDGPYGGQPAYDDIIHALSGLAMLQTVVSDEPRYVPSIIADTITGVHAALPSY
jgi:crotonobetainyl-CoA:carnitine CoA-transferase CaiB-like acyl-CoA transferase